MKKIYVLAFAFLISFAAIAQSSLTVPAGKSIDQKQISKIKLHQGSSSSKADSRWYNYGDAMDALLGNIGELNANYLFPDSTLLVNYSTGLGGAWIHKLADVFDPTSLAFNESTIFPGELALKKTSSYTLDSIEFYCIYARGHKDPTAVDTIIFDVAVADYPGPYSYFGPTSAVSINLGTDTTKFIDLTYDQPTNSFGVTPHTTYKYILNAATAGDTLPNGLHAFRVSPNLSVAANQHFYVSVTFKPGYTWTPNVDSMTAHNRLRFLSLDENPGGYPSYTKGDWNASYIVPIDVRYNTAGSWNGSYIPSFAYMGGVGYSYVHHSLYYKCTGVSDFGYVSVQENSTENNLLGDAYPNPVNASNDLIIPVNTKDMNSSLIISDILGQQVMKFNTANKEKVLVNTSDLNAGLYFYTLKTGSKSITKKFSVLK